MCAASIIKYGITNKTLNAIHKRGIIEFFFSGGCFLSLIISPSFGFFDSKTWTKNVSCHLRDFPISLSLSQLDDAHFFSIHNFTMYVCWREMRQSHSFVWVVHIIFRILFLVSVISLTYEFIFYAISSHVYILSIVNMKKLIRGWIIHQWIFDCLLNSTWA